MQSQSAFIKNLYKCFANQVRPLHFYNLIPFISVHKLCSENKILALSRKIRFTLYQSIFCPVFKFQLPPSAHWLLKTLLLIAGFALTTFAIANFEVYLNYSAVKSGKKRYVAWIIPWSLERDWSKLKLLKGNIFFYSYWIPPWASDKALKNFSSNMFWEFRLRFSRLALGRIKVLFPFIFRHSHHGTTEDSFIVKILIGSLHVLDDAERFTGILRKQPISFRWIYLQLACVGNLI